MLHMPEELNLLNLSYTRINYLHAVDFANTRIYQMITHARSCDRFPESVEFMHFSNPDFQILDLPPLSETTITFRYEDEHTIINPINDIVQYNRIIQFELNKQMGRVAARTRLYKEDLMIQTWHPSRVEDWCGARFGTLDED